MKHPHLQTLHQPKRADADTIQKQQANALRAYLSKVVYPHSPYYHKLFNQIGFNPENIRSLGDLEQIPFTQKEDLSPTEDGYNPARDFILTPDTDALRRKPGVIARALLHGRKNTEEALDREFRPIFMTSTTGRSAEPTPFFYTNHDLEQLKTAGARLLELGEYQKDDRILNMFPYAPHLAYWLVHYAARARNLFCVATGGGKVMGTEGNLRMLKKVKPTILVGMPTFVYHVLHAALDEKASVESLRFIVLGGEKVPAGTRRKLAAMAEKLGATAPRVMSTYGFTEAKLAYGETPIRGGETSTGYFTYPDLGIIEVVDPESGRAQPPGQGGEIVYTPLQARGTVVLRYRTGDYIENGLVYEPCPRTGITYPRLSGKISRVSDIRPMQLRKLKGTLVDFNHLEHLLDNLSGIGTWQLELRKVNDDPLELDELILHLSADGSRSEEDLCKDVKEQFIEKMEIAPNRIDVHDAAAMRTMQKVGDVMKEEKIVDHRNTTVKQPESSSQPETSTYQNAS